jgi:type IV pilus assembly protein PilB
VYIEENKLKEFIIDSGLVSRSDIIYAEEKALAEGGNFADILVAEGKITADDLTRMQAYVLGIPFVDLRGQKIDPEVLNLIPEPIARNHNIVAFRRNKEGVEVAMIDTNDLNAIDFVKKKIGQKILPRLTNREGIKTALVQYQKSLKAEFGDIIQKESAKIKTVKEGDDSKVAEELTKIAEDLPVVKIVDTLIKHAIIQNASDIHVEPQENELLIRYRIDGILRDAMVLPKNTANPIIARIKVLANLRLDEKRLPQDGRFKMELEKEQVSFRVSVLPIYFGEKVVIRLLKDSAVAGFSLEGLGFHGEALERIHKSTKEKTGMILTSGPTGSGKTTTLYTILDILNTPEVNISTVEDPIEYQMKRINQTQVRPEIGLTFASGLRSLLRQDPDIIMVGEIRDNETAALATNASLTGHLVLSTIHTNSAAGAIPRLLDMKVEPFLLVSTLNVIIGQRLVRRLCEPKEKYFISEDELMKIGETVDLTRVLNALKEEKVVDKKDDWKRIPFYRPKKSDKCPDGYSGRLIIHEVIKVTPAIKNLIMKGATSEEIEKEAKKEGMLSMMEDGIFKAAQGLTTIEEVFRVISE